jgi:hypothetical protein
MHIYQQIYEFAASAGAFEGYVYRRPKIEIDVQTLSSWVDNLLDGYSHLAPEVVHKFQTSCDQTLGRAAKSLTSEFGEEHLLVTKLKKMVKGELPETADDFQKTKWFQS